MTEPRQNLHYFGAELKEEAMQSISDSSVQPIQSSFEVDNEIFDLVEQAKQEWEATIDSLPQLVCLLDIEGRILRANRTLERWGLGQVTSANGEVMHDLLHPECGGESCIVTDFLNQSQAQQTMLEIEAYDSRLGRHFQMRAQPVTARGRVEASSTVVILTDISRRKEAEEALQQLNHELEAALRVKEQMLANVSHELRTPLTIILGYSHMLADGEFGVLSEEQRSMIDEISGSSLRLQKMVNQLILLQSLNRSNESTRTDLTTLIFKGASTWRPLAARSGIKIGLSVAANVEDVTVDGYLFEQVIHNLFENAIKFSPPGSQIKFEARTTAREVILTIADEGIGIPPQNQSQVFEPFYQGDGSATRTHGGMGIGLALCRNIVQAHGGRIWVESLGNSQGSTFYIALPY